MTEQTTSRRWLNPVLVGVLGLLVLLAYSNSFRCGMVIDNQVLIGNDPRLRNVAVENVRLIFSQEYWWPTAGVGVYRPLATLSYWFNYAILGNGENPAGYHVVNFLLQWLNAVLAYFFSSRLLREKLPAFFAAALFALHPVGTEVVTNIVGRTDQLAATLILAALLCYIRSTEATGWRRAGWLALMSLSATAGMFSKENAVVVVAVILLYDVVFRPRQLRECWRPLLALLPVYIVFWIARKLVFAHSLPSQFPFTDNPLIGADFWMTRLTAIKVLSRYLWLLIWPAKLSCDYSYNEIPVVAWDWQTGAALAVLAGIVTLAVWAWRRNKPLFFFIAFAAGTMLPTSNLIVLIGNIMGERYAYVPLIGFAGCVVVAAQMLPKRVWPVVLVAGVVACGVRTFARNVDWRDSLSIWRSAVEVCPGSFKTQKSYAKAFYDAGLDVDYVIGIAERARAIIEAKPLTLAQQSYGVYADLGYYHVDKAERLTGSPLMAGVTAQSYRRAVEFLDHAAAIEDAVSRELAVKLARQNRSPSEISHMGDFHIYGNLGLANLRLGNFEKSIAAYAHMQKLEPGNAKGYLGASLAQAGLGRNEEANVLILEALLLGNNDEGIWREAFNFYAARYPGENAVVINAGRPQLNVQSPLVRRHLCEAYRQLARAYRDAGMEVQAGQIEEMARKEQVCL